MDWNIVLLIAFIIIMLFCCGGMMMGFKHRHPTEKEKRNHD